VGTIEIVLHIARIEMVRDDLCFKLSRIVVQLAVNDPRLIEPWHFDRRRFRQLSRVFAPMMTDESWDLKSGFNTSLTAQSEPSPLDLH